jgi:hypothetical protein
MNSEDFLAVLAPAITDAEARARFLADPKAALAAAGLDFPEWFTVTAREGDAVELTITLPDLVQSNGELTDMDLATVSAGFGGSFPHSCAEFNFGSTCALCGRIMPR